jgi:hypothetical protein
MRLKFGAIGRGVCVVSRNGKKSILDPPVIWRATARALALDINDRRYKRDPDSVTLVQPQIKHMYRLIEYIYHSMSKSMPTQTDTTKQRALVAELERKRVALVDQGAALITERPNIAFRRMLTATPKRAGGLIGSIFRLLRAGPPLCTRIPHLAVE